MTSDLATQWAEFFKECIDKQGDSATNTALAVANGDEDEPSEPPMKAIAYRASEPDRGYLPTNQGPSSAWEGSAYTTTFL